MNELLKQMLKFLIVGGMAFLIDYGVLFFLTETVGIHYLLSCGISFSISIILNYFLSTCWVYHTGTQKQNLLYFIIFVLLSAVGLGINLIIMWAGVELFMQHYLLVKIIATMIVMVFNFISRKLVLEH